MDYEDIPYIAHAIQSSTKLRFDDPAYTAPKAEDLRELMRQKNLSGSTVARLVGVTPRTVRKWATRAGMPNSAEIPYAVWRLLLIETGVL